MTDEEIEAAALSDPDNPPLIDEELARMMSIPNVQEIRERPGLTVEEFAERFALNPWQVKRWESRQELVLPDIGRYLMMIEAHPEAVLTQFGHIVHRAHSPMQTQPRNLSRCRERSAKATNPLLV